MALIFLSVIMWYKWLLAVLIVGRRWSSLVINNFVRTGCP